MKKRLFCILSLYLLIPFSFASGPQLSDTLRGVQARGELRCGQDAAAHLAQQSPDGLSDFYTAFCRALAIVVLGDSEAVSYVSVAGDEHVFALSQNNLDILFGDVTEAAYHQQVALGPVIFYGATERYGPIMRAEDEVWFKLVNWLVYALIQAEEWGVDSQNIGEIASAVQDAVALERFLAEPAAAQLGLEPGALSRAIAEVGNYGEIYERYLGLQTGHSLPRGPNRLWLDGGELYALPFGLE